MYDAGVVRAGQHSPAEAAPRSFPRSARVSDLI